MNKPMSDKEWETKEDLCTLKRHAELAADTKRLAAAKAMAKKEADNLQKIASTPKAAPKAKTFIKAASKAVKK